MKHVTKRHILLLAIVVAVWQVSKVQAQVAAVPPQGTTVTPPKVDKRSLREKAEEMIAKKGNDSTVAELLEQWMLAVPADPESAYTLAQVYGRLGRKLDSAAAMDVAWQNGYTADPRIQTFFATQKRYGRYKVLMPARMKPKLTYPMVLLLQGNGNSSDMMIQLARSMQLDSVIFVCPEAPYLKLKESFSSMRERFTASGDGYGVADKLLPQVVDYSAEWYYNALTDAREKLPVSNVKTTVVGFSQGGFYSLALATRYTEVVGSVVTICASMYEYGKVIQNLKVLHTYGVPVLVTHALNDPVVPFQTSKLIVGGLVEAGVDHKFFAFEGGHWPTAEAMAVMKQWILNYAR
ncbi:MAG: alpha/beta fold hydrolase [Ignavibacteria bacterium]|nr:alpha/beta fold hydrolase [Ignavibacteria bacterium]